MPDTMSLSAKEIFVFVVGKQNKKKAKMENLDQL